MLEPLIVLTVLNCIFMFSSTVTTCALWWKYQSHRCCSRRKDAQQKSELKKSKNYTFLTAKKPGKSQLDGYADVSKSSTNAAREHRKCQKKRSKKHLKYLTQYQKKNEEKISSPDRLDEKKLEEKAKMSEASQTVNDTKSTVVMEFSTVQKIVQIVDNDSEINSTRAPFKDIIIQKDTAEKKYDDDVEQNFASNMTPKKY